MSNTDLAKDRAARLLKKQGDGTKIGVKQSSKQNVKQTISGSISSLVHSDEPNPQHRVTVKVENTFQMGPDEKFPVKKIESIARDVIESYLSEERYEPQFCKLMSKTISEVVRNRIRELRIMRYKVVALIQIGEQGDHGLTIASRCIWDPSCDSYATYEFKNGSLYAVATIFGVYQE